MLIRSPPHGSLTLRETLCVFCLVARRATRLSGTKCPRRDPNRAAEIEREAKEMGRRLIRYAHPSGWLRQSSPLRSGGRFESVL